MLNHISEGTRSDHMSTEPCYHAVQQHLPFELPHGAIFNLIRDLGSCRLCVRDFADDLTISISCPGETSVRHMLGLCLPAGCLSSKLLTSLVLFLAVPQCNTLFP